MAAPSTSSRTAPEEHAPSQYAALTIAAYQRVSADLGLSGGKHQDPETFFSSRPTTSVLTAPTRSSEILGATRIDFGLLSPCSHPKEVAERQPHSDYIGRVQCARERLADFEGILVEPVDSAYHRHASLAVSGSARQALLASLKRPTGLRGVKSRVTRSTRALLSPSTTQESRHERLAHQIQSDVAALLSACKLLASKISRLFHLLGEFVSSEDVLDHASKLARTEPLEVDDQIPAFVQLVEGVLVYKILRTLLQAAVQQAEANLRTLSSRSFDITSTWPHLTLAQEQFRGMRVQGRDMDFRTLIALRNLIFAMDPAITFPARLIVNQHIDKVQIHANRFTYLYDELRASGATAAEINAFFYRYDYDGKLVAGGRGMCTMHGQIVTLDSNGMPHGHECELQVWVAKLHSPASPIDTTDVAKLVELSRLKFEVEREYESGTSAGDVAYVTREDGRIVEVMVPKLFHEHVHQHKVNVTGGAVGTLHLHT